MLPINTITKDWSAGEDYIFSGKNMLISHVKLQI